MSGLKVISLKYRVRKIWKLIFIWSMFSLTVPFVFNFAIPINNYKLLIGIFLLFMFLALFKKNKIIISDFNILAIIIVQIFGFIFLAIIHNFKLGIEYGYLNLVIQNVGILIAYLYISNYLNIEILSDSFINIMIFLGIIGIVVFLLGLFGMIRPINTFELSNNRTGYNFILSFSNAITNYGKFMLIRIASFFDEPGTFAYYLTFALLLNKINDFSSKKEKLLILAGLSTLSLAFYITIFFYYLLFYFNNRNFKKFLLFVSILVICILLIISLSNFFPQIESIKNKTVDRLKFSNYNSDMKIIQGDNRTRLFIKSFGAFLDSPLIGQGVDHKSNPKSEYYDVHLGANLFSPLAKHGIIGTIIFFLLFFYWTVLIFLKNKKIDVILISSWLIVVLNFFQRPIIRGGFLGYFIFIFLVEITKKRLRNY